ncbi:MAG: TMEM165/GDT1 family protein [Anaerolineae bacterium]|nr:TMEM165/GDT1 family protein [Anaerolineae bacterium]
MFWKAFLSTFGLLLLAEMGDKTQLAAIAQVCKFQQPWAVFLGATLALALVTGLGVLLGQLLATLVPGIILRRLAATAFVVMGILMWIGVL